MRLSKRLPYEIALGASLALGSCASPPLSDLQREEVATIASDEVGDSQAYVQLRERVEAIEKRLGM